MTTIALVVGSVSGTALDVAEQLQQALEVQKYTVIFLKDTPDSLPKADIYLFCTSTTGRGNLPRSLTPMADGLRNHSIAVAGLRYGIIALGDSRYPTFCGAGRYLDELLTAEGATRIGNRLEIDADRGDYPDEVALSWLPDWLSAVG